MTISGIVIVYEWRLQKAVLRIFPKHIDSFQTMINNNDE